MAFEPWALFLGLVAVTAGLPLYYATLRPPTRTGLLYGHAALMQLSPGLIGALYEIPLFGDVVLTPGNVSYSAIMMTAVLIVLVERRPQVLRTLILLLLGIELLKLSMLAVTGWALSSPSFEVLVDIDPGLFDGLLVLSLIGYVLIVAELLAITAMFQFLRRRVHDTTRLSLSYVAVFAAVLIVDGVLYPLATGSLHTLLSASAAGRMVGKVVLAGLFSLPLLAFVLRFRAAIERYAATPLRLREVLFSPNRDLVARLEEHERERIQLLERTLHVAEDERRRLAEDLHDDAIQLLTAADIRLQRARSADHPVDLGPVQRLVQDGVGSLRRLILELRGPDVTAETFEPLVHAYVDRLAPQQGVAVDLQVDLPEGLPDDVVGGAYRIVLEAFSNAVKHARADSVEVRVGVADGLVVGAVLDDGIGIPPDAETGPGHLGLRAMQERAGVLGGRVDVLALDVGTSVTFALPVTAGQAAGITRPLPPGPLPPGRHRPT